MESMLHQTIVAKQSSLSSQALGYFLHTLLAMLAWAGMMLGITLLHPVFVPPEITLGLSLVVPMFAGMLFGRLRNDGMAQVVWLSGMIWFLILSLWVLDLPTGPNQCYHCDASQKLGLTFLSFHHDSGLLDGQGRFLGTWPAAALIGYSFGAWLSRRKREVSSEITISVP